MNKISFYHSLIFFNLCIFLFERQQLAYFIFVLNIKCGNITWRVGSREGTKIDKNT